MAITFKTGNPEPSEFSVPPGDYNLRVVEAKEDTSKEGNDLIKLKLRIIRESGDLGLSLYDYLVFTANSFWKIDAFLMSCGKHPGVGMDTSMDANETIGWECKATLKVETYEGKKSNKVAAYLWDDGF